MGKPLPPPPDKDGWTLLLYNAVTNSWLNSLLTGTASTILGFDSSGNPQELTHSGTGTVVALTTSPAFTTPSLGAATAASLASSGAISGTTISGTAVSGSSVTSTGAITSSSASAGVGYATGSGGAVPQSSSKSTGVTLNKICGQVTMNAAALAAGAKVSFVVTNSACVAPDLPFVGVISGGTANAYRAAVTAVGNGQFTVTVENITAGSLSEQPVIGFAIIKAVTS